MRLTAIKIAGFKSFVDPTTVVLDEQLIGIVGPNGCGKSNIVDAIRWVLGESKASSLRGENLADVIFNGSEQRKAVDRASVELIFDNSDSRITGQWGQYTEISVKRVLERQGDSTYQINRQNVRRKDVTALFLGTGVGPRGYSIIEQGMISRLIEAKPEELRLTLEEAAGVSKYRERRRETEQRLSDAKSQLERVSDVAGELDAQITRLSAQAETAKKYHALVTERQEKKAQQAVLLLRKAEQKGKALADDLVFQAKELESIQTQKTAFLATIEQQRLARQELSDQLDKAQADFYQANGEVVRIETDIRHRHAAFEKVQQQLHQLAAKKHHTEQERQAKQRQIEEVAERLETLIEAVAEVTASFEEREQQKIQAEKIRLEVQSRLDDIQQEQTAIERALEIEANNHRHATQLLDNLTARKSRLDKEHQGLVLPEAEEMALLAAKIAETEARTESLRETSENLQQQMANLQSQRETARQQVHAIDRELVDLDAQIRSIIEQQTQAAGNDQLENWLASHDLPEQKSLWEMLTVEKGWEQAVEAVLRERLSSKSLFDLSAAKAFFHHRPPTKLTFYPSHILWPAEQSLAKKEYDWPHLSSKITVSKPEFQWMIEEWLWQVFVAEDPVVALDQRKNLPLGGCFVTATGDLITRNSVSWFAPENAMDSVLSLHRRLQDLNETREQRVQAHEAASEQAQKLALTLDDLGVQLNQATEQLKQHDRDLYGHRLKLSEQEHQHQFVLEQKKRVAAEGDEVKTQLETALAQQKMAEAAMEVHEATLADIEARYETEFAVYEQHDQDVKALDQQLQTLQHTINQHQIEMASLRARQGEIQQSLERITLDLNQLDEEEEMAQEEMLSMDSESVNEALTDALEARKIAETTLSEAREKLDEATKTLHHTESEKDKLESALAPIQALIGELRLGIQAQEIRVEQQRELLSEMNVDENDVLLAEGLKETDLQQRLRQLESRIDSLGPVNLAAINELTEAQERQGWLAHQMADITEAIETLENAIKRIDRDARSLLQKTFDIVNENFGKLFPRLFGGGQGRLLIEGEDLLSAGVRVLAQPPGKKNASIFLLSGGEKALTAVALVFSLFQLNPAPFCLLDEIDAPLDDPNTNRLCEMIKTMSENTQFLFITHNKITMELAQRLVGVTMPESGVSRIVDVNIADALKMAGTA